jgi:DNA-binding Xre family transcriptional regulator
MPIKHKNLIRARIKFSLYTYFNLSSMLERLKSSLMGQQLDRGKMRELRKALGLKQSEAAARAGFGGGLQQWSDIERGHRPNVTLDTLAKIATALGCTSADLLTPVAKKSGKGK